MPACHLACYWQCQWEGLHLPNRPSILLAIHPMKSEGEVKRGAKVWNRRREGAQWEGDSREGDGQIRPGRGRHLWLRHHQYHILLPGPDSTAQSTLTCNSYLAVADPNRPPVPQRLTQKRLPGLPPPTRCNGCHFGEFWGVVGKQSSPIPPKHGTV